MLIKIHSASRMVVGVCDFELFGKKIEDPDGLRQIDLTGKFFDGERKTPEEAKTILLDAKKEDATFNFVGKKSCDLALELNLISEKGIEEINDVPMGLVLL
jgi:hypothetical protein